MNSVDHTAHAKALTDTELRRAAERFAENHEADKTNPYYAELNQRGAAVGVSFSNDGAMHHRI